MFTHVLPSARQLSHCVAKVGEPVHDPFEAVRTLPGAVLPDSVGAELISGFAATTAAAVIADDVALPCVVAAVTLTWIREPTSASPRRYTSLVAPATGVQFEPPTSHRAQANVSTAPV